MRSGLRGSTGVHPPTSTRPIRGTGTRTHSGDRWPGRYRDPRCRACSASTPFASAMLQQRRQLRDRHRRGRPHRRGGEAEPFEQRAPVAVGQVDEAVPVEPQQVGHLQVHRHRADVPLGGPETGAAPLQPRHPRRVLLATGDERAVEDHPARAATGAPAPAPAPGTPGSWTRFPSSAGVCARRARRRRCSGARSRRARRPSPARPAPARCPPRPAWAARDPASTADPSSRCSR